MSRQEQAYHSAVCLAGLVRKDGSFLYRYDSQSGESRGGYNILRHAGAIWALLDTYRAQRQAAETFTQTVRRIGIEPFKTAANAVRVATARTSVAA